MIEFIAGLLLAVVCGVVVIASLKGWGAQVTRCQRIGLLVFAAGLILAAPARYLREPVGWFDVMWLAGVALYLLARHLKHILHNIDGLDGVFDDRLTFGKAAPNVLKSRE